MVTPVMISVFANSSPSKPESTAPTPKVLALPLANVSLSAPLRVPLSVIFPEILGLLPNGKLQLLAMVLVLADEWVKATRLKAVLLQETIVAVPPSNTTVPPFALNVAPLFMVKVPAKLAVTLGAVNAAPELSIKLLFASKVVKLLKSADVALTVRILFVINPEKPLSA